MQLENTGDFVVPNASFPQELVKPRWYAVSTIANHERRVAAQLGERKVEHFLPQYESLRRWKDRQKKLLMPLFPGYVFVHIALRDRLVVLQVPGVARIVGFGGIPCALPDTEIESVQACLARRSRLEPHSYVNVGKRVRVKFGALEGLEGVVIRKKNRTKFVLSLELIKRSVAMEIDGSELEPI